MPKVSNKNKIPKSVEKYQSSLGVANCTINLKGYLRPATRKRINPRKKKGLPSTRFGSQSLTTMADKTKMPFN